MRTEIWTVARFPNGTWSYGGRPDDPDYEQCEVFRVLAADGPRAVRKAQGVRVRAKRKLKDAATPHAMESP
jgi:hypothetical protein